MTVSDGSEALCKTTFLLKGLVLIMLGTVEFKMFHEEGGEKWSGRQTVASDSS